MRSVNFRIVVDIMLITALLLSMAYLLIGIDNHEWVGTAFFVLFFVHVYLNRKWFLSIFKGKYSAVRVFRTGLNLVIFILMLGLMVSGMIFATYTPNFIKTADSIYLAGQLHMLCAYWCFVLLSVHLGVNLNMLADAIIKKSVYRELFRFIGIIAAFWGVFAFMRQKILSYMFLQQHFVDFSGSSLIGFCIDYIAMMSFFALIGYSIMRVFSRVSVCKINRQMKVKGGME